MKRETSLSPCQENIRSPTTRHGSHFSLPVPTCLHTSLHFVTFQAEPRPQQRVSGRCFIIHASRTSSQPHELQPNCRSVHEHRWTLTLSTIRCRIFFWSRPPKFKLWLVAVPFHPKRGQYASNHQLKLLWKHLRDVCVLLQNSRSVDQNPWNWFPRWRTRPCLLRVPWTHEPTWTQMNPEDPAKGTLLRWGWATFKAEWTIMFEELTYTSVSSHPANQNPSLRGHCWLRPLPLFHRCLLPGLILPRRVQVQVEQKM